MLPMIEYSVSGKLTCYRARYSHVTCLVSFADFTSRKLQLYGLSRSDSDPIETGKLAQEDIPVELNIELCFLRTTKQFARYGVG